ncbi:MAG: winged helix-turn-helix transcriptional regulator [Phenylobacterium sp.]|jgi:DNA-binding transcriptional ArsR family regulator|uniref:metalloregulator ArsR/SmtB family transcription factor n=1 Tax=Phenylobacterium sp. TaxID=1871053 RepID=UPI0025EBE88C|nr:metalloregulator ArsR/SmtB family transcription factor [Phenylobacterium sp.]MCA3712806.1 winged helix-turn-helix transcriptional regulator [Phenylobacterium sp.]MCA3724866.1 winged helix-turn-helix transcriptional regulator [Phenylobacterium sp.]MCA3727650.1 winged helix-turn-helix transcriptional regulator [Phenylobacterium sp.]MCA6229962.1 winged helix-turn-helix transcriptional regulator [Phenylobacterium sp.]MCA6241485.1 winged helix-turn-helix transcriptional regulator [Phenylobacteri
MNSLFKALSHPLRRKIVEMLRAGDMTSGDIAAAFDVTWPTVTGHLTALKDAGLVDAVRVGPSVSYRLNISAAEEAIAFLLGLIGSPAPAGKFTRNEDAE